MGFLIGFTVVSLAVVLWRLYACEEQLDCLIEGQKKLAEQMRQLTQAKSGWI